MLVFIIIGFVTGFLVKQEAEPLALESGSMAGSRGRIL